MFSPEPKTSAVHLRRAKDGVAFVSEGGLADTIRLAFEKVVPARVRWRPYVLRSFAGSQLMPAENAGLLSRDVRELVLGHAVDIARRYNIGKSRLRTDPEEQDREAYAKAADRFLRVLALCERVVDYGPLLRVLLSERGCSRAEIDALGELRQDRVIEALAARRPPREEVPLPRPGRRPEPWRLSATEERDRSTAPAQEERIGGRARGDRFYLQREFAGEEGPKYIEVAGRPTGRGETPLGSQIQLPPLSVKTDDFLRLPDSTPDLLLDTEVPGDVQHPIERGRWYSCPQVPVDLDHVELPVVRA